MVEIWLEVVANFEVCDNMGLTPLMLASKLGNLEAVKILLVAGAQVDKQIVNSGDTALSWAATEGHLNVVTTLLSYGANADHERDFDERTVIELVEIVKPKGYETIVEIHRKTELACSGNKIGFKLHCIDNVKSPTTSHWL